MRAVGNGSIIDVFSSSSAGTACGFSTERLVPNSTLPPSCATSRRPSCRTVATT
jgi:hypothetical protein